MGLEASSTIDFEETVSKLRKAETMLRGQGINTSGQNLARRTFTHNKNGSGKIRMKGAYFHCGKPGHFKKECKTLLVEQDIRLDSDTQANRREVSGGHRVAVVIQDEPRTHERAWATICQVRKVASRSSQSVRSSSFKRGEAISAYDPRYPEELERPNVFFVDHRDEHMP